MFLYKQVFGKLWKGQSNQYNYPMVKSVVQNEMQQSNELKARRMHVDKNFASSVPRNHEVSNK